MAADQKQEKLRELFEQMRRLKQEELPRRYADPVEQAYHDARVRGAIRAAEEEIERVINYDPDGVRHRKERAEADL